MYLCLTALIQLNLLATRNPSLWWRFGSSTAPRHALPLVCCLTAGFPVPYYSFSFIMSRRPCVCFCCHMSFRTPMYAVLKSEPTRWKQRRCRPSLVLLAPVAAFLLAATLIAVYWPARAEPDASRGSFDGAGA